MSAVKHRSSKKAVEESNPDFALPGIGNYMFVKTLGEGNFAKVKLAKHKLTGQEVAIKVIDKTQLDEKKVSKLYREVRIMKLLHHPHIVRLYEVIETKSTVFLVMEYSSGGELYDYLVVHGRMKEKEALAKFRQILSAVSYCHKKRVIHRDLKAENLLLDGNLDIKIADFGFSNLYDPDSKLDTFCGSPPYAAPELFQGRRYTGPEVDVWSLGVILYVLTTGCLPFDGKNLQEMRESVCRGKYRIPFYLSDSCEKLLRKFLIRDPYKRASLDIVIDDPWINESYPDSPIVSDLSAKPVTEDEQIMKIMESKFHINRSQVLKCLREGIYDDVAAIYYLLYHERDQKREITNVGALSTKVVPPPPSAGCSAAAKKESDMVPIDEDDVLQNNAPAKVPKRADVSESDSSVPSAVPRTSVRGSNVSRRRRFTVGGEADMQKLADDDESREVAAQLKLLQQTVKQEGDQVLPIPSKVGGDQTKSYGASGAAAPAALPKLAGTSGAATPPSAPTTEEGEEWHDNVGRGSSGRRRHSTIVGLLRSTIHRQLEESGNSVSPAVSYKNDSFATATTAAATADGRVTPENGGTCKPRSLRFTFNSNTTSSKPPDEVVAQVLAATSKHGIQHRLASRYLIECSAPAQGPPVPGKENVKFEIEICKLPRLRNLHGLRFKRLSGASSDYKDVCEKLLEAVAL